MAQCKTTKEIWDKLKNIYEGNGSVKQQKLQSYRTFFENLKMKDEENIASYLIWVDKVVNGIKVLGEDITNFVVVKNVRKLCLNLLV